MTRFPVAIPLLLAVLAAPAAVAQQADTAPGLRPARFADDTLRFTPPPALGYLLPPRLEADLAAAGWSGTVRAALAVREAARWRIGVAGGDSATLFGLRPPPSPFALVAPPALEGNRQPVTVLQRYADLGIVLNARFELRYDHLRNLRCQPGDYAVLSSGCGNSVAPPRLDPQFNVRTGGIVGQRVHLDVDYDSQREFDASNNIKVFYQGLQDEVLQRVEVGNVTFRAPASRFITGGIPSNNFGFQASGQLGPIDFSGIYAQQRGNVVSGRSFVVGQQTLQPVDRQVMDRDYEPNRFFFVVDPATLPGYPNVDVLNLNLGGLPRPDQVLQVRVYRRRSTTGLTTAQQQFGGIPAVALRPDSPQRAGPFPWELLIEGRDYYLDPSGLWFALTNQLDNGDYLAVSYVTAAGDTVGTFPAAARAGRTDTLRLINEPQRGPDAPTFRYMMRNVYRVGGASSVVRDGLQLRILVAQSERPASGAATFVALLGLGLATDQTQFDQFNRLFPRSRDPAGGAPLRDYYVVFPSLMPFADSTVLPPAFRNDSLYRTPTYLLLTQGPTPLYQLALHYQAGGGDAGTLNLGAVQLRPGSERLTLGGRPLVRNVDYTINYEVGQVTFLHPDSLFATPGTVNVQYEEQPGFAIAPTSIYGLQTRYDFGDHGAVTVLGLLQQQQSNFTRPPLGFEPQSNFVGGISGNFRFEPQGLTRLLNRLPLVRTEVPSLVTVDAELATSRPSPNQVGQAWVETFEGEGGSYLPLTESSWTLGSRPASAHGLQSTGIDVVGGFDDANAVPLVWQNLISTSGGGILQYTAQQIDPSIVTQGTAIAAENVLWLTLDPDTVGGLPDPATGDQKLRWYLPHTPGPRWRSITLPLSATGEDLSRVEYLEFWVFEESGHSARNAHASLIFDFGRVFEDAVSFVPTSFSVSASGDTTYTGRRRIGEGHLQTERDTLTNAWNATINDNGVFGAVADTILNQTSGAKVADMPLCTSTASGAPFVTYWGDQQARCTRHNGVPDGEDLDGDGHLDTLVAAVQESYFRYVFQIGDSTYFARSGGPVNAQNQIDSSFGRWRLYRIPFRTDTFQVNAPDIHQIRALRITVVAPSGFDNTAYFALARVHLVGAPWVKRAATPIPGIAGNVGTGVGEVVASVVGTTNQDLGYVSPPGVTDQGATVTGPLQPGSTQINEQSLRLIATRLGVGQRAEAYYQFPEGQRNFLGYRQLHVWARGRGAGWENDQLAFYIKVGQDENNFYMYRAHVHTGTWLPDQAVDFGQWQTLRADIERRFLAGQRPFGASTCGGDTLAYVECDPTGTYIVHVRDPGVAPPNLAQVRELAVGFERDSGLAADSAELWVDDIRLSQVVSDPGYAGAVNVRVVAADVADVNLLLTRRDAQFRQLGQDPSYTTTDQLSFASTVHLERLGLERLGLVAPLTIQVNRSSDDPYLLAGTDVLASGLVGLRRPQSTQTFYSLALRRSKRGKSWWERWVVDNLGLSGSLTTGSTTTQLSQSAARAVGLSASYQALPDDRSVRWVPGFVTRLLGAIPLLGRSALVRGMEGSKLRWTPAAFRFTLGYARSTVQAETYSVPIATASDTLATTVHALQASLRAEAGLDLRPLSSLTMGVNLASTRDLKDYGDSTTMGILTRQQGQRLLGLGVGFETQRSLATRLTWAPNLFSWLRPRFSTSSTFGLTRDPNGGTPERSLGDTAGAFRLPTAFTNARATDIAGSVDFSRMFRSLLGDSSHLLPWLDRLAPLDLSTHTDLRSQFSRAGLDPSLGYELGFGSAAGFRAIDGRLAVGASRVRQWRAASAVRLPLGFAFSVAYGTGTQSTWSQRSDGQAETDQTSTTWPDVTGRWTWSPRAIQNVLSSVSASATWRVATASTVQPPFVVGTGTAVDTVGSAGTSQETRSLPVSLSISWAGHVNTNFSYTVSRGLSNQAGSLTQNDRTESSASLSFAFRPPYELLPLKSDIRTSLGYSSSVTKGCITLAGAGACISILDASRRQYNLTMDTDMPPNVSAGLSVGYILTDDSYLDRKYAQLVLTASVTVNFQAGQPR